MHNLTITKPRDVSECPSDCEYGPYGRNFSAHRHCASFGCVLEGEGGGGDDGRSISGYHDENCNSAVPCDTCGLDVCPGCIYTINARKRCYDCTWKAIFKSLGMTRANSGA